MTRDLCQGGESAWLCATHLLDQASVAEREDCEQPDLLEAVELVRNKRTVASSAQDQHRADGFPDGERHDRRMVNREQRRRELRVVVSAFAKAAPIHDSSGGYGLIQQRLPGQPAQWVLVPDEVRGPTALVARLHPQHVLVEARPRAPIDLDVLGRKTN